MNRPNIGVACKIRLCGPRSGAFCHDCQAGPCGRLKRPDARYRAWNDMSETENSRSSGTVA